MEQEERKRVAKMIEEHNIETRRTYHKAGVANGCMVKLDTAFGINSNPICNQLQVVGEKFVAFMVGSIVVVKDLLDKS